MTTKFNLSKFKPLIILQSSERLVLQVLERVAVVQLVDDLQTLLGGLHRQGGALVEGFAADLHDQRLSRDLGGHHELCGTQDLKGEEFITTEILFMATRLRE